MGGSLPATQAQRAASQALAALQRGRAALEAGAVAEAIAWLERSCRYAPDDPAPLLSLAAARLAAAAPALALEAFRSVGRRCDVREAWLGEAVACLRLGRAAEAASGLAACLSRHRWDGAAATADAIAEAARRPGWCALAADGTVALGLRAPGRLAITADGEALPHGAPVPVQAVRVRVTLAGADLIGSPIEAGLIHRVEGLVRIAGGGLEGWAWHPGDAARDPVLHLRAGERYLRIVAADQTMEQLRPLSRPRRFVVPGAALADWVGRIDVTGEDGRPLTGSPLDPGAARRTAAAIAGQVAARWPLRGRPAPDLPAPLAAVPADVIGLPAAAPLAPARPVAVVIPVYRGRREVLACLAAVWRTTPPGTVLLVVDDATPEPDLATALERLAARDAIRLLRLPRNRGFPGAANAGLRAAAALGSQPDMILLNSDTEPAPGWLEALRAAVHAAPDIGTATPLANDASVMSYPDPAAPAPPPAGRALAGMGQMAARANAGVVIDLPTAVGFCMYVRRECLEQVGVFREDVFAQGYGEENDLCLRARHLGWRHVGVPGAYVAHLGGRSFGTAGAALTARNLAVLEDLHPGYRALIDAWIAVDPLRDARRRLDLRRWVAAARAAAPAVLLVTHDSGGGVERCVQARAAALRAAGKRPLLLRPVPDRSGTAAALERMYLPGQCRIDEPGQDWPNLTCTLPRQRADLVGLLRTARAEAMEVHHLLGHDHAVLDLARDLAIPYDMRVHDYASFCPQVTLLGPGGRYCGEPDEAACIACTADLGSRLEEAVSVPELRARSAADFATAARVVVPSHDAAQRLARHFPGLRPAIEPHEDDDAHGPPAALAESASRLVCVVGAIGPEKGYEILLACARDAAARRLPLAFVVVGHTIDDARLLDTGSVRVTGPFQAAEAPALIRAQQANLAFIPSIWPETWCLALGEAWRAGLAVAAFDIGAPAERIRATGRGWLLPLGLPAARVNNALLTLRPLAAERRLMQTG